VTDHDKQTHDSLVDRLANALQERYGHEVDTHVQYREGEVDVAVYDDGAITRYYEVKSNDLWCNYKKSTKQIKRFINYKEGTVKKDKMDTTRRGVYVSQKEIGGEFTVKRII